MFPGDNDVLPKMEETYPTIFWISKIDTLKNNEG
jgi:hypothetical protein